MNFIDESPPPSPFMLILGEKKSNIVLDFRSQFKNCQINRSKNIIFYDYIQDLLSRSCNVDLIE